MKCLFQPAGIRILLVLLFPALPIFGQKCTVNPIMSRHISKPKWTGECVNGLASGKGTLYEFGKYVRYIGEMKNGSPDGSGTLYTSEYCVEGTWVMGEPLNVTYYLREVQLNQDGSFDFVNNGLRYARSFRDNIPEIAVHPTLIDTSNYTEKITRDTSFYPKNHRIKHRRELNTGAQTIFYVGYSTSTGFFSSYSRSYFLVVCADQQIKMIHCRTIYHHKPRYSTEEWFAENDDYKDQPVFDDALSVIGHICQCR